MDWRCLPLASRPHPVEKSVVTNILTIDVEDWYMDIDIKHWGDYENRVVQNTHKILNILAETGAHATFFIVGYVAEHFPDLVESIKASGHEIATHGYRHKEITRQSPSEFEEDLLKCIRILKELCTRLKKVNKPKKLRWLRISLNKVK